MSKTAKEVLIDYKKNVMHITRDIELLRRTIINIINECTEIDNSNLSIEELNKLINELNMFDEEVNNKAYDREIPKDTHIAIETLKEIKNFLGRKTEDIAKIKVKAQQIRLDVLRRERNEVFKKYQNKTFESYELLSKSIIQNFRTSNHKNIATQYLEENASKFINYNQSEILYELKKHIEIIESKEISKELVNNLLDNYKENESVKDLIKEEYSEFINHVDNNNFSKMYKDFIIKTENKIIGEEVRAEIVKKIILSIRDLGFNVDKSNVIKSNDGSFVAIRGEKITGETATFKVNLDGSYVYDFDGYEGHEHDTDSDAFIQKLRDFGLGTSDEFSTVYRKPKFIAKKENKYIENSIIKKQQTNNKK